MQETAIRGLKYAHEGHQGDRKCVRMPSHWNANVHRFRFFWSCLPLGLFSIQKNVIVAEEERNKSCDGDCVSVQGVPLQKLLRINKSNHYQLAVSVLSLPCPHANFADQNLSALPELCV